jgi:hypothetical protein
MQCCADIQLVSAKTKTRLMRGANWSESVGYLREVGNYQGSGREVDSEDPLARFRVRRLGLPAVRLTLNSLCSIAGHRSGW